MHSRRLSDDFFFENKFIFILFAVISVGWSAEQIKLNFLNCFFYYNLELNKMLAFRLSTVIELLLEMSVHL